MNQFEPSCQTILHLLEQWEPRLSTLSEDMITNLFNKQNRSIRQILGHLIDSASNNTHRIVHLQYGKSPLLFPNYATNGNNDRWIAIQHYQQEKWHDLIQLWKYCNLHIVHVIRHVVNEKLNNQWQSGESKLISLKENIEGYLPHLMLHLNEIEELMERREIINVK